MQPKAYPQITIEFPSKKKIKLTQGSLLVLNHGTLLDPIVITLYITTG